MSFRLKKVIFSLYIYKFCTCLLLFHWKKHEYHLIVSNMLRSNYRPLNQYPSNSWQCVKRCALHEVATVCRPKGVKGGLFGLLSPVKCQVAPSWCYWERTTCDVFKLLETSVGCRDLGCVFVGDSLEI